MKKLLAVIGILVLSGCASAPSLVDNSGTDLADSDSVVLLTNLHPDSHRKRLYSVNYLQPGLLKACDSVSIIKVTRKALVFNHDGLKHVYYFHPKSTPEGFGNNIFKYFGTECPAKLKTLTGVDKKGVESGTVMKGMSKDAVILAIGYPPQHETPSLESREWKYWVNRFNTKLIRFDDSGKVSEIID